MIPLISLAAGLLFGAGLAISGMTRPAKVIGFLDFFGQWDPTLLFVMAGAVGVYAVGYRLARARGKPVLELGFEPSVEDRMTGRLFGGSTLFGVGWGLSGFCPGPAVTALASTAAAPIVFVAAMLAGMAAHRFFFGRSEDICG